MHVIWTYPTSWLRGKRFEKRIGTKYLNDFGGIWNRWARLNYSWNGDQRVGLTSHYECAPYKSSSARKNEQVWKGRFASHMTSKANDFSFVSRINLNLYDGFIGWNEDKSGLHDAKGTGCLVQTVTLRAELKYFVPWGHFIPRMTSNQSARIFSKLLENVHLWMCYYWFVIK